MTERFSTYEASSPEAQQEVHPQPFPETCMVVDEDAGGVIAYVSGWDRAEQWADLLNAAVRASATPPPASG